jgi:hypothetical protein
MYSIIPSATVNLSTQAISILSRINPAKSANFRYILDNRERTVLESLITTYCVRYDPYRCKQDPERIWTLIEKHNGRVHAGAMGCMDFYVPERLITQVLLMDSGLRVRYDRSYI